MTLRTGGSLLAGLVGTALSLACARAEPPHVPPPLPAVAGPDAPGLPPLPSVSPRNASYSIDARLDPVKRTIAGTLVLEWRNTSDQALSSFPFHLYWNAFRNDLSTSARGEGRRTPGDREREERSYGWIQVKSVRLVGEAEVTIQDLTPTLLYLHPDGNVDDRTVFEVRTASPVAPGEHGTVPGRVGGARAPRQRRARGLGSRLPLHRPVVPEDRGLLEGALERAPVLPVDRVLLRLRRLRRPADPAEGLRGGGDGAAAGEHGQPRRDRTLRFVQEDVHDFAWTASRRFLERRARFEDPGYPPVDIRLLLQPEHAHLAERYLEATKIALRTYGTWSAPYPYAQITVVDPAYGLGLGRHGVPDALHGRSLGPRPARAAEPGGRHHPRGRPPVLVRPRREQRVRGGLARRGLQHLHDVEGHRPLARARGLGAALLRGGPRARRPGGLAAWWPRASGSPAAATASPPCARAARPTSWRGRPGPTATGAPTASTRTASPPS